MCGVDVAILAHPGPVGLLSMPKGKECAACVHDLHPEASNECQKCGVVLLIPSVTQERHEQAAVRVANVAKDPKLDGTQQCALNDDRLLLRVVRCSRCSTCSSTCSRSFPIWLLGYKETIDWWLLLIMVVVR